MTNFDGRPVQPAAGTGADDSTLRSPSLYRRLTESTFEPLPVTAGPWRPDAQHGGPPAALLTFLCEQFVGDDESLARMQVRLLTGIPLEPLESRCERRTVSRRVAHIEAELRHGSRPVATATALVLAAGDVPEPAWRPEVPLRPDWHDVEAVSAPHWAADPEDPAFHRDGLEHRFVEGAFDRAGPAVDWVRLRLPVVEGAEPSGAQRVLGSVDVASGISAVFDPADGFGMINADLDVAFVAPAQGEWLLLDAATHIGPSGTGVAVTWVYDHDRAVAVATQCLLGTAFKPG